MKLFLIDGHALIFKMYYAFLGRPMVNSKGVDTSILFGFTKYLLELVRRERPTHLAVSFDPPGGTFRNEMYPLYKANRGETPQLVIDALQPLTDICGALNIPVLMIPGFEADDVIGSAARRFAAEGFDVYMVTPDKDYGQLVGGRVFQYKPGKSGSDNEILDAAAVCDKWGIDNTGQVVDILAICGDTSDNVPGVQGVGPVGASKLLRKYGSVDGIYANLEELSPRQKEMFEAASDHIGLSRQLVTIKTDINLPVSADDLVYNACLDGKVRELFARFEFNSLLSHLKDGPEPAAESGTVPVHADLQYTVVPSLSSNRIAFCLCDGMVWMATENEVAKSSPSGCRTLLEDASVVKFGFGIKSQMNLLSAEGISLDGPLYDVELMHYLLNPERSHSLDTLCRTCLGVELESVQHADAESLSLFEEDGPDAGKPVDCGRQAVAIKLLGELLLTQLENSGQKDLYDRIEGPLLPVLSRMETAGVRIDLSSLREFADGLRGEVVRLEALIREMSGCPDLNPSSPKQIGEVIFEKLRLDPKAKKPSKGNWPTDEATLAELSDRSPIIDAILQYRGTKKLLSTYIDPFPNFVRSDGRVHTTFNQALTSTGRLSSSNPNLQNIPVRTEQGRELRKAFVAGNEDWVMMSADYSQIELRLMAHLCGDTHMTEAFREGRDVHAATAAKIFGISPQDVTPDQRRVAKTANFGIMYGISAFGLSQRLGCSRQEAKRIIDDYFESFPTIRDFIDDTLSGAREKGYVETLFGRRRYVPDVNAHNAQIRALAERNAVNAPIQGTAADIMKLAMIGVDRRLREAGLRSRMVLQIHDELVLEVPSDEIGTVRDILVSEMEGVIELSVPLTVECNYGKTWLEAH